MSEKCDIKVTSYIDYLHLTKKDAVYLHRKMWSAIADLLESERENIYDELDRKYRHHDVYNLKRFVMELTEPNCGGIINNRCWCCEYASQQHGKWIQEYKEGGHNRDIRGDKICDFCPINWLGPTGKGYMGSQRIICEKSIYGKFINAYYDRNFDEAVRLARGISTLPEFSVKPWMEAYDGYWKNRAEALHEK